MDSTTDPHTTAPRAAWLALALAVAGYVTLIAVHMGAYAGGSDTSGYLNQARLLREGRVHVGLRTIPGLPAASLPDMAYVPLGFRPETGNRMAPTYPVGLPLLIVGLSFLTGWDAASHWTLGLHVMLGLVLMYALARQAGLARPWALGGVVLLASSPLYLFLSVQAMSDLPALVWCAGAVYCAWRSRDRWWWAVPAGAALGMAVLIRPSDILLLPPVAIALGCSGRRWAGLVAGGLPATGALAWLNHLAYGRVLTSGYGDVSSSFSFDNVVITLVHYVRWLPVLLTPLGVLALGLPWVFRESPRRALLLAAWIAGLLGFYAFYYNTHETWWYLRFLLPAFPAFILATLLVARRLTLRWPRLAGRTAAIVTLGGVLIWSWSWSDQLHALSIGWGESVYGEAAAWARAHLPPDAVLATMQTSGALEYYTDFTLVRWDVLAPDDFARIRRACAAEKRPIYAMLFPFEIERLQKSHFGRWTQIGAVRHVTFWRLEGDPS